ncbi:MULTISPECIES: 2-phosphosulfolactate phosphatase [unclassified Yoonia]|uniref:2-phosphosulfolactate phosphatase n=1 Tax=unclassified Yoonia TaxID=2629118 RepID=UPI002AFFE897|nr:MULTISPECIES: 2-phosphosulfolactate phosphatase [unclassified Yoonia]
MQVISEWGLSGVESLIDRADAFVVVDVLSFSTCVDIACANGALVFPFPIHDQEAAQQEADRRNAVLAGRRSDKTARFSLSAPTLRGIAKRTRLLLPSPNGSHISFAAKGKPILAGCLRNAAAVAEEAMRLVEDGTLAVIPAGERWQDGSLRPAIEDLIGAGAVISALTGTLSQEAAVARDVFHSSRPVLLDRLMRSVSGVELCERGFPQDVETAATLNVSACAPVLRDDFYIAAG